MSQLDRLYDLLDDGLPHRTDEIMAVVYGSEHLGLARCAARIYDLKKRMEVMVRSWPDPERKSLTWYQMVKLNFNGVPIDEHKQRQSQQSYSVIG